MIPFSPPHIRPEVLKEIEQTLHSGWITTGPKTKQFEKDITRFCGNKITNALNSATACMEMVLRYWGVGKGDEVIIPAYTYCATANVVMHVGAKPVMVDCGEDFNMDPEKVREAVTKNTKVIIPVDIGGWPCDYDEIRKVINDKKDQFRPENDLQRQLGRILLMADSAHSFGAQYKGSRLGSVADMTVFSFHAVKNLTTAEGGAVCWNLPDSFDHEEIYKTINTMSLHGQSKDALAKTKAGGWEYDVQFPGYKCNMTDIHACLGLVELKYYQQNLDRRKDIVDQYLAGFKEIEGLILPPFENDDKRSSYHLFLLRLGNQTEQQRNEIITKMAERGISTNVHFKPLPLLTAYKKQGYEMADYPVAYQLFQQEITLPVYVNLSDENVQLIIKTLKDLIKEV